MHFILLLISETLNKASIFKRFIDDIVWIASNSNNHSIIKPLTLEFAKHDLKLLFKQIDTSEPDRQLEFLDVLRVIDQTAIKKNLLQKILLKNGPESMLFKRFFTQFD